MHQFSDLFRSVIPAQSQKCGEELMLLNKSSGASHAVGTINLRDTYSVRHWAKVFGVSELDLAIAVQRAGPHPRDVAMFLGKSWR